jgi:serine/threonine-protein kinase
MYSSTRFANPDSSGVDNHFEIRQNGQIIFDSYSGLSFQKSGSLKRLSYRKANKYLDQLNAERFSGIEDWRLPTLEEAMSLMKPVRNDKGLHIEALFDFKQKYIWTCDLYNNLQPWCVDFKRGLCAITGILNPHYVRAVH